MSRRFAGETRIYKNPNNPSHLIKVVIEVENGDTPDDVLMAEMRLMFNCAASGAGALFEIENGGDHDGQQTDT